MSGAAKADPASRRDVSAMRLRTALGAGLPALTARQRTAAGLPASPGDPETEIGLLLNAPPAAWQPVASLGVSRLSPRERARAEITVLGADAAELKDLLRRARSAAPGLAADFSGVQSFCMFIGYPRSGHSLVGALLDAHPDIVISHELDVLKVLGREGIAAHELYWMILENSRLFAEFGRQWGRYSYAVPGAFQGRYRALRVIGDKKGAATTRALGRTPALLAELRQRVGVPVRLIHVVRNPFDVIATTSLADGSPPETAARDMERLCRINQDLLQAAEPGLILEFSHEDFLGGARETLSALCRFLDVPVDEGWLSACVSRVSGKTHFSRQSVTWDPGVRRAVDRLIGRHAFLSGYRFEV